MALFPPPASPADDEPPDAAGADLLPPSGAPAELVAVMRGMRVCGALTESAITRGHHAVGVTASQMRALLLVFSGNAPTATDIARYQGVRLSTATRVVDRLAERGLLARRRSRTDRRRQEISLTPHGQAVVAGVAAGMREIVAELAGRMAPDDLAALARGMGALADAAGDPLRLLPR